MAPAKPSNKPKATSAAGPTRTEQVTKSVPNKTKKKSSKKTVSNPKADDGTAKDDPDKMIRVAMSRAPNMVEATEDEEIVNKTKEAIKKDAATPAKKKKKAAKAADDAGLDLEEPKTAYDVQKGYRAFQTEINKAGKEALEIFAEIKEANGTGMSREKQEQLRKEYNSNVDDVTRLVKNLNSYKAEASDIAAIDRADNRAAMLPFNDTPDSEPPARLIFEDPAFSRANQLKIYQNAAVANTTDKFTNAMLRALLDTALAMAGANRKEANAMIDAFVDPSTATIDHDDPISALTSLKTVVGIPVFVPGSRLEQTERAIGEELFGLFSELDFTRENLDKVLAEAAEKDESFVETRATGENVEKKVPVRTRKARERKPKADEGEGDGKKDKKERTTKSACPPPQGDGRRPARFEPWAQY